MPSNGHFAQRSVRPSSKNSIPDAPSAEEHKKTSDSLKLRLRMAGADALLATVGLWVSVSHDRMPFQPCAMTMGHSERSVLPEYYLYEHPTSSWLFSRVHLFQSHSSSFPPTRTLYIAYI